MEKLAFRVIIVLAAVSFVVYLFAREVSHVYALHQENERVKTQGEELEQANAELMKKVNFRESEVQKEPRYKIQNQICTF